MSLSESGNVGTSFSSVDVASAISKSIHQPIDVDFYLHCNALSVKVKSIDANLRYDIVGVLEDLNLKVNSLRIVGIGWGKAYSCQKGKFKEIGDTSTINTLGMAILLGGAITLANVFYKASIRSTPSTPPPNITSQPSTQITDPNCLYVPESTIAGKSGEEISQFKDELKHQSGKQYVLFSGG